jgi:heptosyltransferase II
MHLRFTRKSHKKESNDFSRKDAALLARRHVFIAMNSQLNLIYLKFRAASLAAIKPFLVPNRHGMQQDPHRFRQILFIRTDRIGDMVLSTPAFKALKTAFPDAALTVLASPTNYSLIQSDPHVDEILIHDPSAGLRAAARMVRELRSRRFEVVIDPMTSHGTQTAVLAYLTQAQTRLGFAGFGREVFFSAPVRPPEPTPGIVELHLALLTRLGIHCSGIESVLFLREEEMDRARRWARRVAPDGERIIGLHPGAHYATQRWGIWNYAALVEMLMKNTGLKPVVLGGPADIALVKGILARTNDSVPVVLSSDLRESMARISQLNALVCNNSGPLHIAVALKVPTVSFMGPTVKSLWTPSGSTHRVLRADDLDCIGCNSGVCRSGTQECMQRLTPEMAREALAELLNPPVCRQAA